MFKLAKVLAWTIVSFVVATTADNFYGVRTASHAEAQERSVGLTAAGSLVVTVTGLDATDILEIHAAEQAALIVQVGIEIPTPIVVDRALYYLLVLDAITLQWNRYYFDRAQWESVVRPHLESAGVEVVRQNTGTVESLSAAAEATQLAAQSYFSGEHVANILLYGNANGPGGSPPTPPAPHVETVPPLSTTTSGDQVGTMAANFRVDESGAATYSIPIATATGTAGVAPQLSLNYSSSGGNGLAGVGWSVGGMSSIARCRKTLAQDQMVSPILWTKGDALCLDGQRLILTSGNYGEAGSVYRTEIDSGAIVTLVSAAGNDPSSFKVERKDGSTSFYGAVSGHADNDAIFGRVAVASAAEPKTSKAAAGNNLVWALKKYQDNIGNPIWFEYLTDTEQQVLAEIRYAYGASTNVSNGYGARVVFQYASTPRTDPQIGYLGGHRFKKDKLLTGIVSYNRYKPNVSGSEVEGVMREYKLTYQAAGVVASDDITRLASVEECVGTICIPATEFNWRIPSTQSPTYTLGSFTMANSNHKILTYQMGDIDGDGKVDFAWVEGSFGSNPADMQPRINYALSAGNSYQQKPFTNGQLEIIFPKVASTTEIKFAMLDYNLDGRSDAMYYDFVSSQWRVYLATPQLDGSWRLSHQGILTGITERNATFADINSDGATDVIYKVGGNIHPGTIKVRKLLRNSNPEASDRAYSFGPEIPVVKEGGASTFTGKVHSLSADFNGDGRADLFLSGFNRFIEPCQGGGGELCRNRIPDIITRATDAYVFTGDPNASPLTVSLYSSFNNATISSDYIIPERIQFVDVNADGLTDVYYQVADIGSNSADLNVVRVNQGDGQYSTLYVVESTLGDNASSKDGNIDQAAFLDWNIDGYPDLVWKSLSNGQSHIRYWDPANSNFKAKSGFGSSFNNERVPVFYPDINADGVLDRVVMDNRNGVGKVYSYSRQALTLVYEGDDFVGPVYIPGEISNRAANKIDTITNGMGMATVITYEPLTATPHYSRLTINSTMVDGEVCFNEPDFPGGEICIDQQVQAVDTAEFYARLNGDWDLPAGTETLGKTTPVLEMNTPMYVVTKVESDAPAAGTLPRQVDLTARTSLSYSYAQANVQAAGRGFLGFRKLTTFDEQTGVTTTSTYRQDWPFIGYPLTTETRSASGYVLSQATSEWGFLENNQAARSVSRNVGTYALGSLHPVLRRSVESRYDLKNNGTAEGALLSSVSTDTLFDAEANPKTIEINYLDGTNTTAKKVTTTNTYFNTVALPLRHSRLESASVVTSRAGFATGKNRHSTFAYYTSGQSKGMLRTETLEPGSTFERVSTHAYDAFGNSIKTSTVAGGEIRCDVAISDFDARGRYVNKTYDCLGNAQSQITGRNVYGGTTKARIFVDPAGAYVESISAYTTMGREYFTRDGRGAFGISYVSDVASDCPADTAYKTTSESAGGGETAECVDKLGRVSRSMSRGFDGAWNAVDTEFDNLNRTKRQSEPYDLPGAPALWTETTYDVSGRATSIRHPDQSRTNIEHAGLTMVTVNDKGQRHTEVANSLGETVRVEDHLGGATTYVYNHYGSLVKITDNAGNQTQIDYDMLGRKKWTSDPDKGRWDYGYNGFDEMLWQSDAMGQRTELTYDSLGRPLTRKDYRTPAAAADGSAKGRATGALTSSTVWEYESASNGLNQLARIEDLVSGYRQTFTFDTLGRASETTTRIDGKNYHSKITYDQFGRVYQLFDQAGDGSYQDYGIENQYNNHGYVEAIADAVHVAGQSRQVYRKVTAMNPRGQVTSEWLGNGVTTTSGYDDDTGRLTGIYSSGTAGDVRDLRYRWDTVGNLEYRHEYSGSKALEESFGYDDLNRLKRQSVLGQAPVVVTYRDGASEKLGNIKTKTGVGTYLYGSNGGGPHAVSRAGNVDYFYDANGNNTSSSDGRTIDYTVFNKIRNVTRGGHEIEFFYGPDRSRYKRVDTSAGGTTTTVFVGNVEVIDRPDGSREKKRYIGGNVVQTVYLGDDNVEDYREDLYLFRDHLGSLDVITDDNGSITQEMSFDAWGKRRNASNWQDLSNSQLTIFDHDTTTRGFTGHEMLDEVGLVHMNGRIYDPNLGRFLQADPLIQGLFNTQALNRYSYGLNNPLNGTDPSGYFWNIIGYAIAGFLAGKVAQALDIPILSAVANIAICVTAGPACAVAFSFSSTLGAGGSFTNALKNGLFAGVSAAAFSAIGDSFIQDGGFFQIGGAAHIGSHAITGGILAVAQGGKFGHGFLTAGLTKALNINKLIPGIETKHDVIRAVTAALVGGTISAISGGKFVNGAITAGFAQAYNGNSFWKRAKELGEFAADFITEAIREHGLQFVKESIPGYALYNCVTTNECGYFGWATAVGEVVLAVAGGGVLVAAYKVFKRFRSLRRIARASNKACNCCFVSGTPVLAASGPVAIDRIEPGDLVQTRNMSSGELEFNEVTELFHIVGKEIYKLTIENADGDRETVEVTDNHPYWVAGRGWIDSSLLQTGMVLMDAKDRDAYVISVVPQGYSEDTFNLEVAVNHNFFVGEQQILTHNTCSCVIPRDSKGRFTRGAGGNNAATDYGRAAHGNYRTALGDGYDFKTRLPSGRRPDAVDWNNRVVRELKPDSPRAISGGQRQVERYRQELQDTYGGNWTSEVDVYRRPGQ